MNIKIVFLFSSNSFSTVPAAALSSPNLNLVFHGIDTAATVSLNGKQILTSDNMFSRYVVDVRGVVKEGQNELSVTIQSPVYNALSKFTEFYRNNYTVYPTSHPGAQHGEEHANFIRKMQVRKGNNNNNNNNMRTRPSQFTISS